MARTARGLLRFPRRGPAFALGGLMAAGVRFVRVDGFPKLLVFYRVTPRAVVVVRVLHAARDIGLEDLP